MMCVEGHTCIFLSENPFVEVGSLLLPLPEDQTRSLSLLTQAIYLLHHLTDPLNVFLVRCYSLFFYHHGDLSLPHQITLGDMLPASHCLESFIMEGLGAGEVVHFFPHTKTQIQMLSTLGCRGHGRSPRFAASRS